MPHTILGEGRRKPRRRIFVLVAFMCSLASTAFTQTIDPTPRKLRQEVLKTWTTEQGLPQDFITAIQQTPDGFLWVGTNGGLARFDGLHFRTYLRDGPPALRHRITDLVVDHEGTLWIATSAGLFTYRGSTFRSVNLGQSASTPIQQILSSQANHSILVRTKVELFRATNSGLQIVHLPISLEKTVDCAEDPDGRLWFADGQQITEVKNDRVVGTFQIPSVNLLYLGPKGQVMAGDGHHLFQFTDQSFTPLLKRGVEEFVSILIDHEGSLWMASGGLQGISRFAGGQFEMLDARSGLASNDARVLFEDRAGDLWIGTISGLQRLHRGTFVGYTESDSLPSDRSQYDAIFEDHAGSIWAGTLESGVVHLVGDEWQSYGTAQGVRRGQVRGFADDGDFPVIAISDYGLFAFKAGRYQKLPGIPPGYISSPLRMADGSLWFSVLHKGVFRLQDGVLHAYGSAEGLADDLVWALVPGGDSTIWVASKAGAFQWDGSRWSKAFPTTSAVDSILISRNGGVYLGTTNGLLYRNGSRSWSLTQEDGLPGDTVFSLAEDQLGDLWLGTARGICRIPRVQLDAVSNGSKTVTPELFTEDDGLRSRTVLPISQVTALRGHDGRIWFATASGPVVAEPAVETPSSLRAVLDDISVDDEHFPAGPLSVKPGRHRLVFTFTAPAFIAPEQIRFRYRLLGWDNDWVNADTVREASYVGLAPGEYRFQVQALNRTGEPGLLSDSTPVDLKPFFWQTRLFIVCVVFFLAAIVIEVTRRRTLKKAESLNLRFQERAAERERLASHIHDTFIQDLTGTALQLELLGLQLEEDPVVARHSLSNLAARMREMIARSRDIVSNLHSMAGTQHSLPELLSHIEAEFRLSDTPVFALSIEGEPQAVHPFLRDEVYSICREAVANAFRHAGAKTIEVTVAFLSDKLRIEVRDDGIGMTEEVRTLGRAGHFGISGMKAHARRINAALTLQSTPGVGTHLVLETPLRAGQPLWSGIRSRFQRGRSHEQDDVFDHRM